MPTRFPTPEDIQLPNIGGPRPVAGIDVSGYGRGAQALAESGRTLGKDVQSIAQDIQMNHRELLLDVVRHAIDDFAHALEPKDGSAMRQSRADLYHYMAEKLSLEAQKADYLAGRDFTGDRA